MTPAVVKNLFLLVGAIAAFVVLLLGESTFDEIVEAEYQSSQESWVADGRPRGFWWYPQDSDSFQGRFTGIRLQILLLFKTPTWAKESPTVLGLLRRYRFCTHSWYLSLAVLFVLST